MIIDIVTAKKGGSGKTLVSLVKFDVAFREKLNIALVDMNDMNPDSYLISTSILDFYEERGLIQRVPEEDLEKYTDYKPFFILHAYRLINQQSGHTQNILIIKPRYVIGEDDPLKLNKFSSLDTFILLWKITEFLSVSNLNIDYVVVDTNMSYEALIPWFLEDEEASNKYFSLFWTDYILDADNRDILYQILKAKTVEILKKKIILTIIFPLSMLIRKSAAMDEIDKISNAMEAIRRIKEKNGVGAANGPYINLVINAYIPIYRRISLGNYLRYLIRSVYRKLKRLSTQKINMKECEGGNGIKDIECIRAIISKGIKDRKISNINDMLSALRSNLISLFEMIERIERKIDINNFFVAPIYSHDISDMIFRLRSGYKELKELGLKVKKLSHEEGLIEPVWRKFLALIDIVKEETIPPEMKHMLVKAHLVGGYSRKFRAMLQSLISERV